MCSLVGNAQGSKMETSQFDSQIQCEEYNAVYDQMESFREWMETHEAELIDQANAELRELTAEESYA
jgi:hypothetical protein